MKRWLKEPLLHFVVIGGVLFGVYNLLNSEPGAGENNLVVTRGKIEQLAAVFERTRQRAPTSAELEGLIDTYIEEEVLYREGLAYGLDKDDTIIRRRVKQKLEFMAEDIGEQRKPEESELQACLDAHPDKFRLGARHTFEQVFVNPEKRGPSTERDAESILLRLKSSPSAELPYPGDSTLLEHRYENLSDVQVQNLFGEKFAELLGEVPLDTWHGPLASAFGLHLIRLHERTEGRQPNLDEVRSAVVREWQRSERERHKKEFYASLRENYQVRVEDPGLPSSVFSVKTAEAEE